MNFIKEISAQETYAVRHPVLRTNKPIESCIFAYDSLASTKHFGFYFNNNLIGVLSAFFNKNSAFKTDTQFQIRGMAVLKEHQNKGYGALLVKHCETYIKIENGTLIWLNARENAVPFYKKLGYKINGEAFIIENVGLHYIMIKEIG